MGMHIRRITTAQDFMKLGPIWSKLWHESGQLSPFLSYDWFWCCWHGVWPRQRPEILIVEDAGTPIAIFPLMHWKEQLKGLPVRCLGFLAYPTAQLVDLLAVGPHGPVIEVFLDHLADRSDWDIVYLQGLLTTSPMLKELERNLPRGLPWRRTNHLLTPYLAIKADWKSFYNTQGQSTQKTLQQIQNKLPCDSEFQVEEHCTVDPWSPHLDEVIAIINRNTKKEWGGASSVVARIPEFCRELTRRASKNGWLSLWILRFKGRVIAVEYQLCSDGNVQVLWAEEDQSYHDFLPKQVLSLSLLQTLFERDSVHEYRMTPSIHHEEYWWATGSYQTAQIRLYRPGLYSRLLSRLEAVDALGVS